MATSQGAWLFFFLFDLVWCLVFGLVLQWLYLHWRYIKFCCTPCECTYFLHLGGVTKMWQLMFLGMIMDFTTAKWAQGQRAKLKLSMDSSFIVWSEYLLMLGDSQTKRHKLQGRNKNRLVVCSVLCCSSISSLGSLCNKGSSLNSMWTQIKHICLIGSFVSI